MLDKQLRIELESLLSGQKSIDEFMAHYTGISPLSFAQLDTNRLQRTGQPECVFGQGKTKQQLLSLLQCLQANNQPALATRVSPEKASYIIDKLPEFQYDQLGRCIWWRPNNIMHSIDEIGIVCAGTSDLPVLNETYYSLLCWGYQSTRYCDIGVAGLHRLLQKIEDLRSHRVLIVIAGMEGALPTVVTGLVPCPVIAVPTSIGYGANLQGITALLGMLSSCASGLAVVNIDNGYGAAAFAAKMIGSK